MRRQKAHTALFKSKILTDSVLTSLACTNPRFAALWLSYAFCFLCAAIIPCCAYKKAVQEGANSMRLFAAHRPKGAFLSYKNFNKPKGAYKKGRAVCACPLQGIMAAYRRKGAFFFAFKILLVKLILCALWLRIEQAWLRIGY